MRFGDQTWTYGAFDAWVNQAANALAERGVKRGSHVAVWLGSSPDTFRLHLALYKLGAVVVPLISKATEAETHFVLEHSEAEVLIADVELASVPPALDELPLLRSVIPVGAPEGDPSASTYEQFDLASTDAPADSGSAPDELAILLYTSGSTGKPKGVMIPAQGFVDTGRAFARHFELRPTDNYLLTLPMFHAAGAISSPGQTIASGGCFTIMPRWSPSRFWATARDVHATVTTLFPSQVAMLMGLPATDRDQDHQIRLVITHEYAPAFMARFGVDTCTIWGMTETSGICTATRPGWTRRAAGFVGEPMEDAVVTIRDLDGNVLPAGDEGEIWLYHPSSMLGYFRDEAATAATLSDKWIRSGDLGVLDAQGQLFFRGRIKNLIKRSGENIAGEEVEDVIASHPDVDECIVFGVPDEIRTEEVYAIVVAHGEGADPEALRDWCLERISSWKSPRFIEVRSELLPRLPNEKLDRQAVKRSIALEQAWDRESL